MTWTYVSPSNSLADEVRFLIGDTSSASPKLSNEEIAYLLSNASDSPAFAAVQACRALIAKYSHLVTQTTGAVSVAYSDLAKNYKELAASIAVSQARPLPYAGGISISDRDEQDGDTDRSAPRFTLGMHDRDK
jgi:hypothetical protein